MKQCNFCTNGIKNVDYKDVDLLRKFIDPYAKIVKRRKTSVCASHQRKLSTAIKNARFLALLPFISR